jgi:uncharacterized protein (TIGR03437 family)
MRSRRNSRASFLLGCLLLAPALAHGQAKYSYDGAGRLIKVDHGNGRATTYAYDNNGNLVSRSVVSSGGSTSSISSVAVANGGTDIAQNTWIVIKGTNLVPATTPAAGVIWSTAPEFASGHLPTQLGGVSVTVNNKAAFIYFYCSAATSQVCASDQINALTPVDSTTGPVQVVVTSSVGMSAPYTATMKAVAPAFLLFSPSQYIAGTHADGTLLGPASLYPGASTPAKPNEPVVLYAVGFGVPPGGVTNGSSSQSGSLSPVPVCQIGGTAASVAFAGLISPGLFQFNVTVPATAAAGDQPVVCTYNRASTPVGDLISVQP